MPKFSVKKPYTVLVGIIALLVFGFVTFTRLSTDLLPEMELPYVVIGLSPKYDTEKKPYLSVIITESIGILSMFRHMMKMEILYMIKKGIQ